jgi:hypothetical protein
VKSDNLTPVDSAEWAPCLCPPTWNGIIPPACPRHNPASPGVTSWTSADPLTLDAAFPEWTVRQPDRPEAVIVWVGGALLLAVITAIVVVAWRTVR